MKTWISTWDLREMAIGAKCSVDDVTAVMEKLEEGRLVVGKHEQAIKRELERRRYWPIVPK